MKMKRKLNRADKRILKHLRWIEKIYREETPQIFLFGQAGYRLEVLWKETSEKEQKIRDKFHNIPATKSVQSFNIPCDGGDADFIDENGLSIF